MPGGLRSGRERRPARSWRFSRKARACLSEYTEAVATRLHVLAPKVMLLGGLFQRDSIYAHTFRRRLKRNLPDARVATVERSPELGAAWLAAEMPESASVRHRAIDANIEELAAALTEQRNPRSENLEKLGVPELVKLFVEEEQFVQKALRGASAGAGARYSDGHGVVAQRRAAVLCRRGDERTAGRAGCERDSADVRGHPGIGAGNHGRRDDRAVSQRGRRGRRNRGGARRPWTGAE